MNNIPMGNMVMLTLYVPFLMTAPTLCPNVATTLVMFSIIYISIFNNVLLNGNILRIK